MEKERARERYEDAMAAGDTAVLAERESKEEVVSVRLG